MKTTLHRAAERIVNDLGWLRIQATFRDDATREDQRRFGKLVILDDALMIPGGRGFKMHPHNDMEIISWVLSGTDEHKDSKNGITCLRGGNVQLMSAGTGIEHAENNYSGDEAVHMFQIWIEPAKQNVEPAYQVASPGFEKSAGRVMPFVSPDGAGGTMVINQQAWLSYCMLEPGKEIAYDLHMPSNGVYVFVILGEVAIESTELSHRDGLGIHGCKNFRVKARQPSRILFIEVPMN